VADPEELFRLLDEDRSGELSIDEFIGGCMRLKKKPEAVVTASRPGRFAGRGRQEVDMVAVVPATPGERGDACAWTSSISCATLRILPAAPSSLEPPVSVEPRAASCPGRVMRGAPEERADQEQVTTELAAFKAKTETALAGIKAGMEQLALAFAAAAPHMAQVQTALATLQERTEPALAGITADMEQLWGALANKPGKATMVQTALAEQAAALAAVQQRTELAFFLILLDVAQMESTLAQRPEPEKASLWPTGKRVIKGAATAPHKGSATEKKSDQEQALIVLTTFRVKTAAVSAGLKADMEKVGSALEVARRRQAMGLAEKEEEAAGWDGGPGDLMDQP
jgi:hypothetical protein